MRLELQSHTEQKALWPSSGRHILAQYDESSVVVYQAYKPSIGHFAAKAGHFGGDFSFSRMSWIKPNFLWMMYRSGWGAKPDQEVTLALWLKREFFDALLAQAVWSSYQKDRHVSREEWKQAVQTSTVRLQWDPDHGPKGAPLQRRAIQLGLRGATLEGFKGSALLGIEDISDFVAEQRAQRDTDRLITPRERPYPVSDPGTVQNLGLASP